MGRVQTFFFAMASLAMAHATAASANEAAAHTCLTTPDARAVIAERRLIPSSSAMSRATVKVQAEALAGRLCLWNEEYVYEITLLRRDGRVIHAFVDALTGKIVGTQNIQ